MTATARAAQPQHDGVVRHREAVMGTVVCFDIVVDDDSPRTELYRHLARARSLLHRVDATFSLWKPNSPMSMLRRGEIAKGDLPAEMLEVLELCDRTRELTGGWFDAGALPGGLDPTGLVKGWAAQQALALLVDAGFHDAMVNAAGDIATSGGHRAVGWRIGVQHPFLRDHLLGVVRVDGAIATSGDYERGAHLFDPRARRHRTRFTSASVTGPDLAIADALATGLAVAGSEGFAFIEALGGYEAFAVGIDGSLNRTTGFAFLSDEGSN